MRDLSRFELQTKRISEKLDNLKNIDRSFSRFGSKLHKYELSERISIEEVETIEKKYNINLPDEYVAFITTLGNGGAGPYCGLIDIESSIKWSKLNIDINKPSMLTSNECIKNFFYKCATIAHKDYDKLCEKIYETYKFSNIYNGTISIASGSYNIDIRLIINGCNSGKTTTVLWDGFNLIEDLSINEDLFNYYFEKNLNLDKTLINFLDWYEKWLDTSVKKIQIKK